MNKTAVLYLILLLGLSIPAQTIAINGKVTDQSGKAIPGAIVTLKSKNIKDTTDASGEYSINAVSVAQGRTDKPMIRSVTLNNGFVNVHLVNPASVQLEVFNIQGNLLEKTLINQNASGICKFNVVRQAKAANMLMIRITIGNDNYSFRLLPLANSLQTINSSVGSQVSSKSLAKMMAAVDSLQVSALGYKTKTVPVNSYTETDNITLETEVVAQCTQSVKVNMSVSGTGPHKVVVETNSDQGIKEGTIYRPEDLGPGKNYPIFIWGEGACSLDGKSTSAAMAQIASNGYFVIADGTPGGSGSRAMDLSQITKPARAYVTWAIAENSKPCSAYYQSLDTTKVAGSGFSCGGYFGQALAGDPRTTTWGVSSSGSFADAPDFWKTVHTPVLILEGSKDIPSAGGTGAYNNGLRDFNGISPLKWPVYFISNKNMGHGGDLWATNGGDFTRINLAWLNWWLKGDTGATGKGVLVGSTCKYCTDSNWEIKSANLP